jgi:hypothetical protein
MYNTDREDQVGAVTLAELLSIEKPQKHAFFEIIHE